MVTKPRRPNPVAKRPPRKLIPDSLRKKSPPRTDQSKTELVYVTPAIASEWLKRNQQNRPQGAQKLAEIKRAIELGLWVINGETIKFCVRGILRDGQTRLTAIAETGIAVWCWVCYDLPSEVFDTIDQGRNRNLAQLLAIRKHRNYNCLAHAVKIVYDLLDEVQPEPGGFVPRIGLAVFRDRPEIEGSLDFVLSAGIKDVYSVGAAAGLHYLMSRIDPDKADSYWTGLATGVISNQRSPIRAVRDTLLSNKMATIDRKLTPRTLIAIVIKGWRLYRDGRTCKYIRWGGHESFPSIDQ